MKLFKSVVSWLRGRKQQPEQRDYDKSKCSCPHGAAAHTLTIQVLGVECDIESSSMCKVCTEAYLNAHSTLCASCERPIFPGENVGQAGEGASHPYVHLTFQCCDTGALFCGRWGEGRLITLHELNPTKYPAGTSSVLGHVFNTGGVVIENMD